LGKSRSLTEMYSRLKLVLFIKTPYGERIRQGGRGNPKEKVSDRTGLKERIPYSVDSLPLKGDENRRAEKPGRQRDIKVGQRKGLSKSWGGGKGFA